MRNVTHPTTRPGEAALLLALTCFAVLMVLPYLLGPVLVRATQRASAAPRFESFDPALHRVPEPIAAAAREAVQSLVGAGWTQVADVYQTGYMAGMATRLVLLEKPATGQQAACIGICLAAAPNRIIATYVEILASFSDGRTLLANNSGVLNANAPVPGKTLEQFPAVRDPARLAAIHAGLIERMRGEASLVPRDRSQEVSGYLVGMLIREMEEQIPLGYLWLDRSANAYRPTWKGAALMCWKLLPPTSTIRHARIRRRADELVAALAATAADARTVSAPCVTAPALAEPSVTAPRATRKLPWVAGAAIAFVAAYFAAADTSPAGALEPASPPSAVPADFAVPNDFPGAVLALQQLVGSTAGPLIIRDSLGARAKVSGASIGVAAPRADSLLAAAQRHFLERGFFLFRHEPNYGLEGRPDQLALVPLWDQYRVVKLVGTSGANLGITNADIIAWLRALEQDAPFVLTGVGADHIEGRFTARVADPDAIAQRLYRFCPDVVDQGTGSVAELAVELRRLNTFYCWWD